MRTFLRALVLGVAVAALAPASAAAGGGGCHGQTEGTGDTVKMSQFCFTPSALHVEPGTTVEFVNEDPAGHVVLGTGWAMFDLLHKGDTFTHRFDEEGAYPYTCNLHPGMNGVVLVGDGVADLAAAPIAAERDADDGQPVWLTVVLALGVALLAFGLGFRTGGRSRA